MTAIVPAAPGYFLTHIGQYGAQVRRTPIIGWSHYVPDDDARRNSAWPIVAGLQPDFDRQWAIECPDGSVVSVEGDDWWPSVNDWQSRRPKRAA